jgi:dihydroorotate dehydrogenase
MITLSNGHTIEYVVASGALGFDGRGWPWERPLVWAGLIRPELFTVVGKTVTLDPHPGNLRWWKPWECIRPLPGGGWVNKVGLTNPGFDWWCRKIGPRINRKKINFVCSIHGNRKELVEMTKRLNGFKLAAIEVDVSCPNIRHEDETAKTIVGDVNAVCWVSRHPVIVKVSVDQDYLAVTRGLEGIAEAIDLNAVLWETIFPDVKSPLSKLQARVGGGGGGVSGRPAQKHNWAAAKALAEQGSLPVIAPSIMEFADLARVRAQGASAVSFGAIHLLTPWKPTSIVRKDMQNAKR